MNQTTDIILNINQGTIRGTTKQNLDHESFYSFQGIPYAKSPIGKLRFKAPQPPETWTGILDCTKEYQYQNKNLSFTDNKHEDYLILNVFTPKLPSKKSDNSPLPVMLWIYGGAFLYGSSATDLYGPEYLLTEDIVLVTFNYRVGPLGFLNFENDNLHVPGNAGLKDIVMALKWVQANINKFCGDPNNVTIFGESAGGAAVHYLILSPLAKGLFHKAIAQSGSSLNSWARGTRNAAFFAKNLGIVNHHEDEILDILQNLSAEELHEYQPRPVNVGHIPAFAPIVEKTVIDEPFLNEEPFKLLESGKYNHVPLMMGYTSCEGLFSYSALRHKPESLLANDNILPYTLNLRKGTALYKETIKKIKSFYSVDEYKEEKLNNILQLISHCAFFIDIYNTAIKHLETSDKPLYFYKFSLETDLNVIRSISGCPSSVKGASHADDICYLFKTGLSPEIEKNSVEEMGIRRMVKMWTNFAKYGNPTPNLNDRLLNVQWKPAELDNFNYLEIDKELLPGVTPEAASVVQLWNQVKQKSNTHSKL